MWRWKTAPLKQAIMAAKSSMVDDAEAMLRAWSENQNAKDEQGTSAFMPVMTTAIASIQTPPEHEQVIGRSEWLDVVIPTDPLQRLVKMRTMPSAFRCQIAFFCPDVHGAMMVANQFCLYFKNESKRTFGVDFEIGMHESKPIKDRWRFRVLDNSLYPDKAATDYQNLSIVTVDCTIVGDIPIVVGLGGDWDKVTDTVEIGTPDGFDAVKGSHYEMLDPPADNPKNIDELGELTLKDGVVHEADVYTKNAKAHTKVTADEKTGEISETSHE